MNYGVIHGVAISYASSHRVEYKWGAVIPAKEFHRLPAIPLLLLDPPVTRRV